MSVSDLFGSIGRVAAANVNLGNAPARIWEELRPWMLRLAVNAAPKWLPVLAVGVSCEVPIYQGGAPVGPCLCRSIGSCDVCHRSCCLNHARIDQHGDAICYLCVSDAVRRSVRAETPGGSSQGAPPPPAGPTEDELRWARRQLGVPKTASWAEVERAYKQKLRKHHPDLQRTEATKAKAEARFKECRKAYDLLRRSREQEAAA